MRRVGVDFHVVEGIYQGSRSHVIELFSRVFDICPDIDFYVFLDQPEKARGLSRSFSAPNVHLVRMPHANPITRVCVQLPSLQRQLKLSILHTQYISPFPSFCKTVITLHDVLFEGHPQYFSPFFRIRSKILMRASAWRSAHVFTVSEYSKREISARYKVRPEQISVTHNGVDCARFYPGADGIEPVQANGLDSGQYILSVGRLEPRKNHISLIEAYAGLETKLPLVIIGQRHFGYENIDRRITELGLSDRVHLLEGIGDLDLASFYRHAKLFVYPTWAEGFGMPVIEAMASGVPVITSNTTSLPEIAEGAGILISPGDVIGLRSAMARLLDSVVLRRELAEQGRLRAESFGWDNSARKVRLIYEKLLNG